ncbi:type IV toxin-antitoxin system AbiEi family antitoxin domain-containing protein [Collimonas silvisoli]|uniref:type IV toxin-antitoxin system AbiEi family antitoxin domain-containing protein n=1 Tax=Collimonas silvisoli TaxID=2825884 RepID=UPI001B8B2041|nr:type IV toxin-antitoxin system AbiEi family antitoxin [Collimonas silvisoli]
MAHHLSDALDACERSGKLNVLAAELQAALPGVSPEGLRKALHRQQQRGRLVRLSRGSDHWLIVPLHYAQVGAPPLEMWLDFYCRKTLRLPYYVGLLSAAENYGASPYAVMVTQVMVEKPRRPIVVGRHEVVFHTRTRLEEMPVRWQETPTGRFRVSTPELTVLDLIQRETMLGGIARVREVLAGLWPRCAPEGFTEALDAVNSLPVAQRLGALLVLDQQAGLVKPVSSWLRGKTLRLVPLEGELPRDGTSPDDINKDFKVWLPANIQGANT